MYKFIVLLIFLGSLQACNKKAAVIPEKTPDDKTYFSIIQFADDQFQTFGEQPYTFRRVISLNGKTDSSYVSSFEMDWKSILQPFFASDISDKKYLDQYNFSLFEDDVTDTRTLMYEAKDNKLFTKLLQIVTDQENNKITSIYVETEKNGKLQKLLYAPVKLIQIQEFETSVIGNDKALKVEYFFL